MKLVFGRPDIGAYLRQTFATQAKAAFAGDERDQDGWNQLVSEEGDRGKKRWKPLGTALSERMTAKSTAGECIDTKSIFLVETFAHGGMMEVSFYL